MIEVENPAAIERFRQACLALLLDRRVDISSLHDASAEKVLNVILDIYGALRIPESDGDGVLTIFRDRTDGPILIG